MTKPKLSKAQLDEIDQKVSHPSHYTSGSANCPKCGYNIECVDIVEHLDFLLGNVVKYVWRAGKKDTRLQDLKKIAWYANRAVDLEERKLGLK